MLCPQRQWWSRRKALSLGSRQIERSNRPALIFSSRLPVDHLQQILNQPECQALDCKSFLDVLVAVKERLQRAEELDVKFYFLGTDQSEK